MAFPTNATVIDDCNRVDESPIAGGWAANQVQGGTNALRVVGNELASASSSGNGYYDTAYGPGAEGYFTVNLPPAVNLYDAIYFVTGGAGTASWEGYFLVHIWGATNTWRLRKRVAGVSSTIVEDVDGPNMAMNDSLGMEVTSAGVIACYHKPAAGAWGLVTSVADSDLPTSGRWGFEAESSSARYDNFSGGTIVSAPSGGGSRMLLLGVGG